MASIVTLNGIPYVIPDTGEVGWGQEVHNYLVALGSGGVLTLEGGNFTLLNELNTGPTYGIASPYFRSGIDPAASTGVLRLTNSEAVVWRNSANTGDLTLNVVGNQLYFAGLPVGGGSVSPLTTKGDLYTYTTTNARLPIGLNGQVLTVDTSTSTGLAWTNTGGGGGGSVIGFTFTNANGITGSVATPTTTPNLTLSLGAITPTSVAASGTITGSNISGTFSGTSSGTNTGDQTITLTGDVTGSGTGSFATSYTGTVPIAKGGTGQTTANAAFNALAPSQTGNNGKVLYTDGFNTSWQSVAGGGSVSSVGGVAANGTIVSVSNPTTTPVITVGLGNITPTSVAASGTVTGSNITGTASGTNTGDQSISLTGDATGTWATGTIPVTLANTTVTPGGYTIANITVDSKGRITAASSGTPLVTTLTGDVTGSGSGTITTTLANSGVSAGSYNYVSVNAKGLVYSGSNIPYLTANQTITLTGDATGSGTTGINVTLANTAVSAGTYNFATVVVDSKGRITGASNGAPVTSVSVVTANGVSGSVANPTTTPAITLSLGAITPTSVAATGTVTGSNLSGTNTGDQTITLTGDVTGSGTGSFATTLATVNSNVGQYAVSTANAKGLVTSATNLSGDVTTSGAVATLANTTVTPGSYTKASITVDSKGRLTSASTGSSTYQTVTIGGFGEPYSTTHSVDASLYNVSKYTLSGNDTVPLPTNIPSGVAYTVTYFITQGSSPYTVTWFTTIKWIGGLIPVMTTVAARIDIYVLTTFDSGTNWVGTPLQGYA